MAKVGWSAGIDYVSGALSKPSKSGQHSCQKMLLGTHRVAATTSNACNRIYLRPKIERSTAPSQDEMLARARFATVSAASTHRRTSPMAKRPSSRTSGRSAATRTTQSIRAINELTNERVNE